MLDLILKEKKDWVLWQKQKCQKGKWQYKQRHKKVRIHSDCGPTWKINILFFVVKLYGSIGREKTSGPVLISKRNQWYLLCDDGFDDRAATIVCHELGFADGRAQCCSQHGTVNIPLWQNDTMQCSGDEISVDECLMQKPCRSSSYASVLCSYTPFPPRTTR